MGCATSSPSKKSPPTKEERISNLMNLSSASLAEGDTTGAIISLNEVTSIDSDLPEAHYLYALAYFQKNEPKLAIQSARKAIQLAPKYSQAKNTLGKLLLDEGNYAEAEKYLKQAAEDFTNRDAFLAQTNLGILNYKQAKPNEALFWLNKALSDKTVVACVAAYYRGLVELDQNELYKAQDDFAFSSKASCTKLTDAHLALGKTYIRLKKFDLARAKMLEIQQLFPHSNAATVAAQLIRDIP